jgi:ADP-heptose:LPS heptosyltransferase
MKTEHILVIRFSALGDVAMTVPVVYSLAHQYPDIRITVLSKPFARVFFENMAPNVGFMEADLQKEYHGIKGLNSLYRRLTAKNFTLVADLHNVLRSDYLRMRFNLDRFHVAHVNKHRQERRQLTASSNKILKPLPTAFDNYMKVFEELGYPIHLEFTNILTPEEANLRNLPPVIGEKKKFQQWFGVAPFAAHKAKSYPLELMEKVIDELERRHPSCRIFLFGGGENEKRQLNEIVDKHKNCMNASKELNGIKDELVLMNALDVMISMDSANMHLASLVNTPVVSIWGGTHPYAGFMGLNQSPDNVVQIDLPCRPCSIFGNKPCLRKDFACLRNISPELIINKVEVLLK